MSELPGLELCSCALETCNERRYCCSDIKNVTQRCKSCFTVAKDRHPINSFLQRKSCKEWAQLEWCGKLEEHLQHF